MKTGFRTRAVRLALLGVSLTVAPAAVRGDDFTARLNGDYAFVQTRVCSQGAAGAAGIDENLVLLSPNSTRTTALRGVMSFDGQGRGIYHSDELQLNASITGTGQQQTGGGASTCDLSYALDAGGRVVINLVGCTVKRDAWLAGAHRLEVREAEAFARARHDEERRRAIQRGELAVVDSAGEHDPACKAEAVGRPAIRLDQVLLAADHPQARPLERGVAAAERLEEKRQALALEMTQRNEDERRVPLLGPHQSVGRLT